jgi:hypothetical protein
MLHHCVRARRSEHLSLYENWMMIQDAIEKEPVGRSVNQRPRYLSGRTLPGYGRGLGFESAESHLSIRAVDLGPLRVQIALENTPASPHMRSGK